LLLGRIVIGDVSVSGDMFWSLTEKVFEWISARFECRIEVAVVFRRLTVDVVDVDVVLWSLDVVRVNGGQVTVLSC
jgi:hypothetical protein